MAACHECGHQGMAGALYCTECGASLLELNGSLAVSDEITLVRLPELLGQTTGQLEGKREVVLMIPASGRHLTFPIGRSIRVGRAGSGEANAPELNLQLDGGLRYGVSRNHARIEVDSRNENLIILDLNSTNGTFLNNFRLPPELPYPLKNGDELRFGHLLVHVFLK